SAGRRDHCRQLARYRHRRHPLAAGPDLGLSETRRSHVAREAGERGGLMIAFLCIVYTAVVVVLFKLKVLKPRPFPIAWVAVAGVLMIGGVVVAWTLCSPMSSRVVTTQYVVQLVSYVKGQVLKVHAKANQPVKKGDLLLEIDPEPFQYTVNQMEAQLAAAKN